MNTKENISSLKDAKSKLEKSDLTTETVSLLKKILEQVKSKGEDVVSDTKEAGNEAVHQYSELQDKTINFVKEHPLKVIGVASLAIAAATLLFHENN